MKCIIYFSLVFLFLFTSCEHKNALGEAFLRYRYKEGVTSVTIPGWVIILASRWGDLEKEERELLRCVDKVRVLTIEDPDLNARSNFHKEFYQSVSHDPEMEEFLVVRTDDEQVTIFGKADEKSIHELLILIGGDDNTMVLIKGKIKPEVLSDLINKGTPNNILSWHNR